MGSVGGFRLRLPPAGRGINMMSMYYIWWVLGLVLIGAEVLMPGFFLLWIGIAAAAMGVILWLVPGMSVLLQAVLFAALAFISCYAYWRLFRPHQALDGDSRLNRRGEQLIGGRYVLETAIVNGRGKARVGDSLWLVEGPELPVGSSVEVLAVDGSTLRVKAAE
jgi:membrane protein implicated in regulation of membrane protease activity